MTYQELVDTFQEAVVGLDITVKVVEDYDVPQDQIFVGGWFNPYFFDCGDDTDIEIELAVNTIEADLVDDSNEFINKLKAEFELAVNHEMVHRLQASEGRFIDKWDGHYESNPNEIEAYGRENDKEFFTFK